MFSLLALAAPHRRHIDCLEPTPAPLLFLHGGRDWVVSIALGERLYALANEPKQFVGFSDAGHEEVDMYGAQDAVRAFLAAPSPEVSQGSKPVIPRS